MTAMMEGTASTCLYRSHQTLQGPVPLSLPDRKDYPTAAGDAQSSFLHPSVTGSPALHTT